jgi:molecular chaperone DnaJ
MASRRYLGNLQKQNSHLFSNSFCKQEGIANVHTGRKGNLIAILKIIYPEKLTDEQKELLEKLHKSFGKEVNEHKSIFEEAIEKVKGWFK